MLSDFAFPAWLPALTSFVGLALGAGACALGAVLAIRRARRQALALDRAINKMSQGLTMFDASGRLVLCNQRYIEMYGLSPDVVRPGCTVGDIVNHRIQVGSLTKEQAEKYVTQRQADIGEQESSGHIFDLPGSRTVVVTRRPLPDGGWVATHDDITERCQAEAQIAYMTHYDTLTDLPNRALFMKRLEAALARVGRGEHVLILHLDLAQFKTINDTLGHSTGDQLLKLVAGRLQSCVRETDTVARLGSDEFAILQSGSERSLDADALARRVREAIAAPCEGMGSSAILDAAVGITIAPTGGTSADQLLSQAHLALSEAKLEGAGIRCFEAGMHARARARRTLEVDLRNALANNEFELYYQPLLNLQRNQVSGCEALLRWYHPRRGLISPGEFIPVAEDTSIIVSLGEWVLRTACREAASWPSSVSVAVNVSPIQLREPNLGLLVASILAQTGLSPHRLEIEVTEAVLMRDNADTIANLNHLRELGVRIAMDDFGTGYSSLSYLRNFAFDKIKIDRSFIKDIAEREDACAIVQAVTTLADRMGIVTVAEGVETQSQLEKSRALGCTEIQGYLFSPPKNAGEIARLLNGQGDAGKASTQRSGAA